MLSSTEKQSKDREEIDRYKRSLARISDQLEDRLQQLEKQGITDGPEVTAIREMLIEKSKPERFVTDTRKAVAKAGGKKQKWDYNWADKLRK